ncbi:MAG: hypothetical protein HOG49_24025 [Candidatus Scalindua sp.]|jgi:hypothetical protein|nr:hypothetical protein [Candidatus Scalindua sp.]
MIKDVSEMKTKIEIDLTGSEGNAFSLLGRAKRFAGDLGLDVNAIIDEMMSGNYENLVGVFDREFGDYVTLYR